MSERTEILRKHAREHHKDECRCGMCFPVSDYEVGDILRLKNHVGLHYFKEYYGEKVMLESVYNAHYFSVEKNQIETHWKKQ